MGRQSHRAKTSALVTRQAITSGALLLAACGGGGGVNSAGSSPPPTSTPAPTPTPTPTPMPTPTPIPTSSADSAEYKASGAVVLAKASYAYDRGITGKGVTVAVIDTGIDRSSPEFAGRISPDSTGFEQKVARCATCAAETVPPYPIDDKVGHGTEVASIALAARDGVGTQGVAPEATLLALKIVGPDLSNQNVNSTGPIPEGSSPNTALIAPAIRYAVDHGAFVINFSGNGVSSGQSASDQRSAMDAVRTGDRLFVESVSNDTGQDSFTGQIAQNLVGTDLANKDWFLFAVGVDQNGNARSANGNAGPLADRMLAATGNNVTVVDQNGSYVTETGNSFAAPAVAGAAALLKQYWPQLGGKAIARILLDTATDAGAPGVDAVYGAGILNVAKAMQAQAPQAAFVEADKALARFSSLTMSAPFGGAAAASALNARVTSMTVFDRYGRDYAMSSSTSMRVRRSGLLASGMLMPVDPPWAASLRDQARFGLVDGDRGPWAGNRATRPASVSFSPADGQTVAMSSGIALGQSGTLAGSPLRGIASVPVGNAAAWTVRGWTASWSSGTSRDRRATETIAGFATPLGIGLELSSLVERGQVLGLGGDPSFGIAGATTTMATLTARRIVAGVALTARASASRTRVGGGSELLRFERSLVGTAFAIDAAHRLFGGNASLGASSPLRLQRATAIVAAPASFDLMTGVLQTAPTSVDLTPRVRELDLEAGWGRALSPTSSFRFGVARAFDAGHVAGATDTAGYLAIVIR